MSALDWFYLASPWIGIALTLAVVAKLIQLDVFPGAHRIKAFVTPTETEPTPEELAREAQIIAQLKATGYQISEEFIDDGKPMPLPRRVVHPITVMERQSDIIRARVKTIRRARTSDDTEVA